jgi:hypothetical protein
VRRIDAGFFAAVSTNWATITASRHLIIVSLRNECSWQIAIEDKFYKYCKFSDLLVRSFPQIKGERPVRKMVFGVYFCGYAAKINTKTIFPDR